MPQRTQLRLVSITGSFGSTSGHINDNLLNKAAIADIDVTDLSGSLSYMASSIRRIHGGTDFSNQTQGEFSLDILPSTDNLHSLGSNAKSWIGTNLVSGSLVSSTNVGTNVKESLALKASDDTSLVYSASAMDTNTYSHNFQGVPLELDSLASTKEAYDGMTDSSLYNIDGTLYFGNTVINASYDQIKSVTEITSIVAPGSLLSTSNFSAVNISNIPVADRYTSLDIYFNGNLLSSGSAAEVTSGTKDYNLVDATDTAADLKFSFQVEVDDTIGIIGRYAADVAINNSEAFGSNTQLQYNSSGSLAASSKLAFDGLVLTMECEHEQFPLNLNRSSNAHDALQNFSKEYYWKILTLDNDVPGSNAWRDVLQIQPYEIGTTTIVRANIWAAVKFEVEYFGHMHGTGNFSYFAHGIISYENASVTSSVGVIISGGPGFQVGVSGGTATLQIRGGTNASEVHGGLRIRVTCSRGAGSGGDVIWDLQDLSEGFHNP